MAKQRLREVLATPLTSEYIEQKAQEGWRLHAVEWERESRGEDVSSQGLVEEIPYGLQIAGDCHHLEENPAEKEVLVLIMEQIVQDQPLSRIADVLNSKGHRTRQGTKWSPVAVFNLMPRLVEAGPRIFSASDWAERREELLKAV